MLILLFYLVGKERWQANTHRKLPDTAGTKNLTARLVSVKTVQLNIPSKKKIRSSLVTSVSPERWILIKNYVEDNLKAQDSYFRKPSKNKMREKYILRLFFKS